jgi:hypothetical protein
VPWALISLLLAVDPTNPPAPPEKPAGVTFPTAKSIDALQACLTDKLADVGEIAAVQPERGSTILLVRGNPEGPMVIELSPASVTVTTKFITGTREIIKGCL